MGLFGFGKGMNEYVAEAQEQGIQLLDVREPSEFQRGHVKGAINIPVGNIAHVKKKFKDLNAPIYVYCLSGGRSAQACRQMKVMGYTNAKNIGGISSYSGEVVRGNK